MRNYLIILLILFGALSPLSAQIPNDDPLQASAWQNIGLFLGPSYRYGQSDTLYAGITVSIVERTLAGNWVRVQRLREDASIAQDGWVLTGFLNQHPDLNLGDVPITDLPDADMRLSYSGRTERKLYETPILSPISPAMHAVYQLGQELGNNPAAFTKIGDSLIVDVTYLEPMSLPQYELGAYRHLEPTLLWFAESATSSIAAQIGMTSYTIFDPMWADPILCNPAESPLECELRIKKPSIAFILFGQNDLRHMPFENFEVQISAIVEHLLAHGVIPILSTFSLHPDDPFLPQGMAFNSRLVDISVAYEVPLINLWAASRILPNYGLDVDNIHMNHSGFSFLKFDTGHEAQYGVSLQNLLALTVLDQLRRELGMDAPTSIG
jgi:hypothetical protein